MADKNLAQTEKTGLWQLIENCSGTANDRKNQYIFVAWTIGWALTLMGVGQLLKSEHGFEGFSLWLLAISPAFFAFGALFAYLRFLREADEFLRKIQLDGLAIGFGVGVMIAVGYELIEKAGAPVLSSGDLAVVMLVAWGIGQLYAILRYR